MGRSSATAWFAGRLVGALGLLFVTGCGGEGGAGTIQPPETRPSEYAAREAADASGAVRPGGAESDGAAASVMNHRRAAAARHR